LLFIVRTIIRFY